MRNLLSIFSFKKENPLRGFLLFLALVAGIESVLAFRPENTLITSLKNIRPPDKSPDIQIMGDSLAYFGIVPGDLSLDLGGRIVENLAVPGTGPAFPYFMLKRQISEGRPPKSIILAPSSHGFGASHTALLVSSYATWPEVFECAASRHEPLEVLYGVICRGSYTLRHREQLAEVLKGRGSTDDAEKAIIQKHQTAPKTKTNPYPLSGVYPMYKKPFSEAPFAVHFFERFLQEAKERNIPIYWVSMPTLAVTNEARAPYRYQEDYGLFLLRIREKYKMDVLFAENPVMAPENFKDYAHLNPTGAKRFTEMLAQVLRSLEPANREVQR
jgi:hypothetical protein